MANSKISALTSATTPLAGTETLPIVQSSSTKKIAVSSMFGTNVYTFLNTPSSANLAAAVTDETGSGLLVFGTNPTFTNTAGSAAANFTNSAFQDVLVNLFNAASTTGNKITVQFASNGGSTTTNAITSYGSAYGSSLDNAIEIGNSSGKVRVTTAGDVAANTGNFIPLTAAKGMNFTANTPLAGKTSTLLNWYEEGTWTPNQGAGLTLVGAFSSTGKYTRVGRNVTVSGTVTGATSVAVTAGGVITTNLPFTIGTAGHGNATNAAITAFAAVICNTGTTLTSAGAIAATGTITFSATYFV